MVKSPTQRREKSQHSCSSLSMATLNWLAKQLSLVLMTKKKETIIGELERVAGVSTADELHMCAADKIVLKAPDFRDCHTIHTEGLAIDVDTYFSLTDSLRDIPDIEEDEDDDEDI